MNMQTFGDVTENDPTKTPFVAHHGLNMGNRTLGLDISIHTLRNIGIVRNRSNPNEKEFAQRELDIPHAERLAIHTIVGLVQSALRSKKSDEFKKSGKALTLQRQLGLSDYAVLQPVVCNIMSCKRDGSDLELEKIMEIFSNGEKREVVGMVRVYLGVQHRFSIVDGQHRLEGFNIAFEWIKQLLETGKYPNRLWKNIRTPHMRGDLIDADTFQFWTSVQDTAWSSAHLKVECHLGLSNREEQQLFADLNDKGKAVNKNTSLHFDRAGAINAYIEDILIPQTLKFTPSPKELNWEDDNGSLVRKDLNPICSQVMFGKPNHKTATPAQVDEKSGFLIKYWETIQKISGFGEPGAKSNTVAAQSAVLQGIAKLAYDLGFGNRGLQNKGALKELWLAIETEEIDFSHSNLVWSSLMLTPDEREEKFPGISKYVHVAKGTNLDAGTFNLNNSGLVRYGVKKNDILPRIGDLIRYQLNFQPRPSVTAAIKRQK